CCICSARFRIDDRLNPILEVPDLLYARASHFTAYEPHTSHILRSGTHIFHRSRRVSCSFLQESCRRASFPGLVTLLSVSEQTSDGPKVFQNDWDETVGCWWREAG